MHGFTSLMMPTPAIQAKKPAMLAASADFEKYNATYYLKGALAGGICCAITHGALW
jgi:hypothetical protein